jgi:hypothetical protein
MNNQRRMFRGRGGPNDRRLPKHNARRRKPHNNSSDRGETSGPKYDGPPQSEIKQKIKCDEYVGDEIDELSEASEHSSMMQSGRGENEHLQPTLDDTCGDNEVRAACIKEIQHLDQRILNVQESIQTSSSIVTPSVYQEIVLNAVSNCVNEWRSIVLHYSRTENGKDQVDESEIKILSPGLCIETSLRVFQLIQLSLQSGPLSGAKPGYFKRCGSDTANIVAVYLEEVVPQHQNLIDCMGFSARQMDAMNKWKANAETAAANDKAPSKSVLKKQQKAQKCQKKK